MKKQMIILGLAGILAVSIGVGVWSKSNRPSKDLAEGVSYIKALEKAPTDAVEERLKEIKTAERKAAFANGETDIWQQFYDSVIMGDSRAVGFSYYGLVDSSRVFAKEGATILNIEANMESVKNINPSSIFLCYGMNDIGHWGTVEEYIKKLNEVVTMLQENMPDADIYINSIIPVTDIAYSRFAKWKEIPQWNEAIAAYCAENQIGYVDVTSDIEAHRDLYEPDGIHVKRDFYEFWAIDMILGGNENE